MEGITALIDFADPHGGERVRHAFGTPLQTLVAHTLEQVKPLLDAVQAASAQGQWCVGYVRYEAAPAFDSALKVHPADGPLAWFAVFDTPCPGPNPAPPARKSTGTASSPGPTSTRPWTRCTRPSAQASCTR